MLRRLNIASCVVTEPQDFSTATHLILPGVGAFDYAMEKLNESGLRDALATAVQDERKPLLGVCVGMQMLADSSDEGSQPGLGWVPGTARSFASDMANLDLAYPHMGWNTVRSIRENPLLDSLSADAEFYFLHSYYFSCEDSAHALASTSYGADFTCAVGTGNVYGVQFHPEKSHEAGADLLQSFAETQ